MAFTSSCLLPPVPLLPSAASCRSVPAGRLGFEALTLAPFDRRLVSRTLLDAEETAQVDAYHARVLAIIGPQVEPQVRAWLETACAPL